MPLPNPGMSFTPFDPLPASDLNDMVENIEALQDWSAYTAASLPGSLLAADSVKSRAIDWAATGAGDNGGIWWEEIGRATASGAVSSLDTGTIAARKYLKILQYAIPTGALSSLAIQFNGDTGSNYYYRVADNGGSQLTGTTSGLPTDTGGSSAEIVQAEIFVSNLAAKQKIAQGAAMSDGAGGTNIPKQRVGFAKWNNTSAQITRVVLAAVGNTMASGSEIIVLGHN